MKQLTTYKSLFTITCLLLICINTTAQTKIYGKAYTSKGKPLQGVNVAIKNSYDGATSDSSGAFQFETSDTGKVTLSGTMTAFIDYEQIIDLKNIPIKIEFVLFPSVNELATVQISAGSIEASDEKRTTVLKPLDIVTTAGGNGDIIGALKTLPGAQQVGESEGLFVRGGSNNETKTIIDGMIVNNPFFSSVPDIAQRARFSPFLFKGTIFSTGGYSAQYGQALSSVLVLETQDLPDRTASTIGVTTVGLSAGHNQLWADKKMSIGVDANYTHLGPYIATVKQQVDWVRVPVFSGGSFNFRKKFTDTGILKFYAYYNNSDLANKAQSIDSVREYKPLFDLKNDNFYSILTYKERIGEKWILNLGASYSANIDKIKIDTNKIAGLNELSQGRLVLSRGYGRNSIVRFGGEYQYASDKSSYNQYTRFMYDNYSSAFIESDIFISRKLVLRLGERYDYSTWLKNDKFSFRSSLAFKTGLFSQVSLAYGQFYQKPEKDYLWRNRTIDFENTQHFILNWQYVSDSITLRAEAYYKTYQNMVTTSPEYRCLTCPPPEVFYLDTANTGGGYARGLDIFFRDKKTFRGIDYWISYTFLDTKREYKNYPKSVTPPFAASHSGSLVVKKFFPRKMWGFGSTYTYSSGRPFLNPNNPEFMADYTKDFHSWSLNLNIIRTFGKAFTVFVFSVTNVLGSKQVFSYRYSYDGTRRQEIGPQAPRSFFIGMFMSFGQNRTKDVINNNN